MPQRSVMQIIACTLQPLPAEASSAQAPREASEEGWGLPSQPTPFIIFTVYGLLWLLFSVHPAYFSSFSFKVLPFHHAPTTFPLSPARQLCSSAEKGSHFCTQGAPRSTQHDLLTCIPSGVTLATPTRGGTTMKQVHLCLRKISGSNL